ncbi:MAG: rRNA bioproteinsis protein rrp36 [Alectoria sarmentosa]|nr:MAG: rRNA bioproteinsis protein rrp36 [Alectoria sarmentosa]
MKPSFPRRPEPARGLTNSLLGRIRARKDASDSGSHTDSGSDLSAPGDARNSSLPHESEETSENDSDEEEHEEEEVSDTLSKSESDTSSRAPENKAASISFRALVRAQASLGKRKRSNDDVGYAEADGSLGKKKVPRELINDEALERKAGKRDIRGFSRTSKHAPAELSSKKAVSRKREAVPVPKMNHRDPRFEPLSGAVDQGKTKQNYSFLDSYRDSEKSELKSAIQKSKDIEAKGKLKRALLSMESRKKAQETREQQQEVLKRHRKDEKEKVEQGKRPFYLKKADQKKRALVERFEGMKGKQVDKVIERRRKKRAAKERKGMPDARRAGL